MYVFNLSTQEAEAGDSEFQARVFYIVLNTYNQGYIETNTRPNQHK